MDPYIGQSILGQFDILEELGRGGMGAVYKARQPDMDRLVAVKILHTRLAARQDLVQRFRREARAMSKLTHPNTIRILLFGQLDNGALYIVMEFLDGKNLLQVEKDVGPMPPARAAKIMIQVCGALEEAHRAGIIHRDLKPENIVLTNQGGIEDFPKVLDFGLAKMNDPDPTTGSLKILTQIGAVFGTPEFMSPEQAKGEPLDPRSDIYSIGVILYEMLTCKLPFKAKNPMDFIAHHIKAEPIPAHERASLPGLTAEHWPVLARSLVKDRGQRYQTATEFGEALASWVVGGRSAPHEGASAPAAKALFINQPAEQPAAKPLKVATAPHAAPAAGADLPPTKKDGVAAKPVPAASPLKAQKPAAPAPAPAKPAELEEVEEEPRSIKKGVLIGVGVTLLFVLAILMAIMLL